MRKSRYFIYSLIGNIVVLTITLSSSLIPFFNEKKRLNDELENVCLSVSKITTKTNYEVVLDQFKYNENFKITMFDNEDNFYQSTLNYRLTHFEKEEIKQNLNKVYEYNIPNEGKYLSFTLYNPGSELYIFTNLKYSNSYYILKNVSISVPIISTLILNSFVLYLYFNEKKRMMFLKKQVRKLRAISESDSIVEFDDEIDNLANILRDTRKKLDKELKNNYISELRLNYILDSISQGICVLDLNGKIILSNKTIRDIFYLNDENKELNNSDILTNIKVVNSSRRPMIFNKEINGRIYESTINSIAIEFNTLNNVPCFSLLMVDITEKYNSEKMKRDFFANAAHELKSPLTTILGFQELIKEGLLVSKEELEKANLKTLKEGERMNKLIMEMLQLSLLENNNLRPIIKINATNELSNILFELEDQINAKNIKIIKKFEPCILNMNRDDFHNLFKNLIENAIKYNVDNGCIYITINNKERFIKIKDTGIGINNEDKQRIFERFYRVDKARSKENNGTGLGLAIVKYICNYYDFKIEVNSIIGKGSEFIIYY